MFPDKTQEHRILMEVPDWGDNQLTLIAMYILSQEKTEISIYNIVYMVYYAYNAT